MILPAEEYPEHPDHSRFVISSTSIVGAPSFRRCSRFGLLTTSNERRRTCLTGPQAARDGQQGGVRTQVRLEDRFKVALCRAHGIRDEIGMFGAAPNYAMPFLTQLDVLRGWRRLVTARRRPLVRCHPHPMTYLVQLLKCVMRRLAEVISAKQLKPTQFSEAFVALIKPPQDDSVGLAR